MLLFLFSGYFVKEGEAALTVGEVSLSGAGSLLVRGSGARAVEAVSVAGEGAVSIAAAGAFVSSAAVSGAGALSIAGDGAVTAGAVLAGLGALALAGVGVVSVDTVTVAGTVVYIPPRFGEAALAVGAVSLTMEGRRVTRGRARVKDVEALRAGNFRR